MEKSTTRILAIIVIIIIAVGVGIGAWYFLLAPGAGEFQWTSDNAPGAPAGLPSDRIIKIGCIGDTGEIQGDANYEGAWFAAKRINEAGGVNISGVTYYVGVTREDSDESNTNLVTSRGIAAAERLVYNKKIQYAIGGFRSEAVLAYQEVFMDNQIVFIDTGAATDIFCQNVKNYYSRYKYFFRWMPINSSALGGEILTTIAGYIMTLNATYPNHDVRQVGILAEDLTWTESLVAAVQNYIPAFTSTPDYPFNVSTGQYGWAQMLTPILYDITLSATDMNTHLNTLATQGCDVLIPVISAQGGVLMMQQYSQYEYPYIIFGIDVQSQLDTFWTSSGESCAYEVVMQTLHRTNKTVNSIEFWDAFRAEFNHDPLYIACGAYDAVSGIVDAIEAKQSMTANNIIAEFESWTKTNPHPGVSGGGAWWPGYHDLVEGYPFGYTLWCQWRDDGTKVVIPSPRRIYLPALPTPVMLPYSVAITDLYPGLPGDHPGFTGSLANGAFEVPDWVETAWS